MTNTPVIVRAQAVSGKFLGMGVSATPTPTLQVLQNGQEVATGTFTIGNSGVVGPAGPDTTPYPIVVAPNPDPSVYVPGPHYLAPSDDPPPDSLCTVQLPLTGEEAEFQFIVTAYDAPDSQVIASTTAALSTANNPSLGVIVPVPGLRITGASATMDGGTVVKADVAMMCGCMITPDDTVPKEPYWPASEFTVTAALAGGEPVAMTCNGPSTFTATLSGAPDGAIVTISASQQNVEENQNSVTVAVSCISAPRP